MEAPKLPINMVLMEDTPAGVGHTPCHHAHSNGKALASTTHGGRTTAGGVATQGAERAPVHQLFVRMDTGRTMTFCVPSWHVRMRDIRAQIRERAHTPTHWQRLVFAGKQLVRGDCTLGESGIGEGSTLELLGRLSGGMPAKGDATNGDATMTRAKSAPGVTTASNSSLLVWERWVQAPMALGAIAAAGRPVCQRV